MYGWIDVLADKVHKQVRDVSLMTKYTNKECAVALYNMAQHGHILHTHIPT